MKKKALSEPVTDTDFLRIIHLFQWSTTNQLMSYIGYNNRSILRRIHKLEPYLHIVTDLHRYLFALNEHGGAVISASPEVVPDREAIYQVLVRNDIWAWFRYPDWHWQTALFPSTKREPLVPDAYWYQGKQLYIVEMDTGSNMQAILARMRRYRGLVKWSETQSKPAPLVYYFTPDKARSVWLEETLGE
ncbi:replication-relaxation family protein, partial [Bacillus toyonensis]|uniref:replication-relaxation family protein n=1 Tax=Bacillus toyonensis TaxID=155322 RepID=UPI000C0253D2